MKRKKDYEDSSGNVFADLGFRNAKQEMLKAKLTVEIYRLLKKRGVTVALCCASDDVATRLERGHVRGTADVPATATLSEAVEALIAEHGLGEAKTP